MNLLERDNRRALLLAIVLAVLIVFGGAALASEPRLPAGYSCWDVRQLVDRVGITLAESWARVRGASPEQIREARRCLPPNSAHQRRP